MRESGDARIASWLEPHVFGHRTVILAVFALVTLALGYVAATGLRLDTNFNKQLPLEHEYIRTYLYHKEEFCGANRLLNAVVARHSHMFTPQIIHSHKVATDEVYSIKVVDPARWQSRWKPNKPYTDVFERGIASRLDFSFSGPQGARLARLVGAGQIRIGAIHTYLELFGRYFIDLTPQVSLIAAQAADRAGNEGESRIDVTLDNTPPVVVIATPAADSVITGPLEIAGTAFDEHWRTGALAFAPAALVTVMRRGADQSPASAPPTADPAATVKTGARLRTSVPSLTGSTIVPASPSISAGALRLSSVTAVTMVAFAPICATSPAGSARL